MSRIPAAAVHRLKRRIKPLYFGGQQLIARALFSYSPDDLRSALREIGIGAGDSVFLHSGFHRSSGFSGAAGDVIDSVMNVVGDEGHLLMMSIPYRGSSRRYAEGDPLFDVARTPSAVGLISEVFRRRGGVLRSENPLHPVLAAGPLAAWLVADHEKCAHSCGKGSPFERFLHLDGKFLFFDAPYSSLTFMHYVEDLFRDQLPVALYHATPATLRVRDRTGREMLVRQYFFSDEARARRNFGTVEAALVAKGLLRSKRVGNTRLLCVGARDLVDCAAGVVREGTGFFR
jgi:aminoglycoside 3-N-acetyltransferase